MLKWEKWLGAAQTGRWRRVEFFGYSFSQYSIFNSPSGPPSHRHIIYLETVIGYYSSHSCLLIVRNDRARFRNVTMWCTELAGINASSRGSKDNKK